VKIAGSGGAINANIGGAFRVIRDPDPADHMVETTFLRLQVT